MNFKTETFVTEGLYKSLINKKRLRRNTTISLIVLLTMPFFAISSLLDPSSTRSFWFDVSGLVATMLFIFILQLPRLTVRRGIKMAQEEGILDTTQVVEFKEEGVVKNDSKTIPYKEVLAILVTPDKYLLTSKGSEWTFVEKETLESEGCIKEFEKLLEENCRQARWTQAG